MEGSGDKYWSRMRMIQLLASSMLMVRIWQVVWESSNFDFHAANLPENVLPEKESVATLVVVIASLRGGELAWESLNRKVLEPNSAHLALAIPEGTPKNTSLHELAEYVWEFPEYDDWGDAIDDVFGRDAGNWRYNLLPEIDSNGIWLSNYHMCKNSGLIGGVNGCIGSAIIHFMYRHYVSLKIQELQLLQLYDRFIVTRSDHFYKCRLNLKDLDLSYVWVPEGEDWIGICDRYVIANKNFILKVLNITEPLILDAKSYRGITDNPEKFLLRRWEEQGILGRVRRFKRIMFTCAADGDRTRWSGAGGAVEEGVNWKYLWEYHATRCNCAGHAFNYSDGIEGQCLCPIGKQWQNFQCL